MLEAALPEVRALAAGVADARPLVREVVGGEGALPEVLVRAIAADDALVVPPVLTTLLELSGDPTDRVVAGDEVWRGTLREVRTLGSAASLVFVPLTAGAAGACASAS